MDYFQIHKQKLVFEDSNQTYAINDTPFDRRLRAAYEAIDTDGMEINILTVERDIIFRNKWNDFLKLVYKVRDMRTERFNDICMNLYKYNGICYQLKNSEWITYNEIEGLWVIIRGDIWKKFRPNICINNDTVSNDDAVFLQFQNLHTYDYDDIFSGSGTNIYKKVCNSMYELVRKRYLSFDDISLLLNLIQSEESMRSFFTTIAIVSCNDKHHWRPKNYVYYFDTYIPGQIDGKLHFTDGRLSSISIIPSVSTTALQRTMFLTNEDCEKYCSLVKLFDSKPYAINAVYKNVYGYYRQLVLNSSNAYSQYSKYVKMDIENLCVK
jgi:hypothetical protein